MVVMDLIVSIFLLILIYDHADLVNKPVISKSGLERLGVIFTRSSVGEKDMAGLVFGPHPSAGYIPQPLPYGGSKS